MSDTRGAFTPLLSLWRGGLIHRVGKGLRLVRGEGYDVVRVSAALALVTWAPMMALALWYGRGHADFHPLLSHLPTHVRWLVSVPLLFAAERLVDERLARLADYLRDSKIVAGREEEELSEIEQQTVAATSSSATDFALLVVAVGITIPEMRAAVDTPGLYSVVVALSLYRFLVLRWLHRWLFWCVFLVRLAMLKLELNGVHPDRAAGLGVLVFPSRALGLVFAALSSTLAADLALRLQPGETLEPHLPALLAYVGSCLAFAALPLLAFTPKLINTKRRTLLVFGVFGQTYVQDFKDRWLPRAGDSPLGSGDIQSLADLGNSYEIVRTMRLVPFSRDFLIEIALAALLPIAPLYLHTISIDTLASELMKVVF